MYHIFLETFHKILYIDGFSDTPTSQPPHAYLYNREWLKPHCTHIFRNPRFPKKCDIWGPNIPLLQGQWNSGWGEGWCGSLTPPIYKIFPKGFQKYIIHGVSTLSDYRDRGGVVGGGVGKANDPTNIQGFASGFQKYMIHGVLTNDNENSGQGSTM